MTLNKKNDRSVLPRGRKVTIKEEHKLLPFLFELLKEQSRSSVKALLAHRQIWVNGRVCTQFDTSLTPGDEVLISYERGKKEFKHPMLSIVWEDNDLIVVNKKEGLLSVANQKEKERTAYRLLSDYVKKTDPGNKIFIIQRLDRDVSGLMMFAKKTAIQRMFRENPDTQATRHIFVAVTEGRPEKDTGLLISESGENSETKVYVATGGRYDEVITRYRILKGNNRYSLVELIPESGKGNRIRAQMKAIGLPIARDMRYGAQTDPAGRLMLHAHKLTFTHPVTGEELYFDTRIPDTFSSICKK